MATTSPVTAQQHAVIIQSAEIFENGVSAMNSVYSEVFSAGDQLKGQAMVSSAGAQFAVAVTNWVEDFNNVKALLQAMHDQLLSTTTQTMSTNQSNAEIASGLNFAPPSV